MPDKDANERADNMPGPAVPTGLLNELLDGIGRSGGITPVREMERVLALGTAAVPRLIEALNTAIEAEDPDALDAALWYVVLLGELRDARSLDRVLAMLQDTEYEHLALAAAEALVKLGDAAVPHLAELAGTGGRFPRILAYAALGWVPGPASHRALLDALERDADHVDVIALALQEHGDPRSIPALYRAYERCHAWQRIEVESAIRVLHFGKPGRTPAVRDWRVRYRPPRSWPLMTWPVLCNLVREHDAIERRRGVPVRPLDEILAEPRSEYERAETICDECGEPFEQPSGLPVCPENGVHMVRHQIEWVEEAGLESGDLIDWLTDIDGASLVRSEWLAEEHKKLDRLERRSRKARKRPSRDRRREIEETIGMLKHERGTLTIQRLTAVWLLKQGIEDMARAADRLREVEAELLERWGEPAPRPEDLDDDLDLDDLDDRDDWGEDYGADAGADPFREPGAAVGAQPRVGRNEPCPCGSGRKHKRCCLAGGGADAERRAGATSSGKGSGRPPGPEIPMDIQRQLIGQQMDRHYREWLDEPVPALDGRTPRDAARDPAMRRRVEELVRGIERLEESRESRDGWAWDASWLRDELGLR